MRAGLSMRLHNSVGKAVSLKALGKMMTAVSQGAPQAGFTPNAAYYPAAMDSLVASAARLLAAGDPLSALKRVALRNDAPALALRGIAMAQLGDYERARKLLRRAA